IPESEQLGFVQLARQDPPPSPIPSPSPLPGEIGLDDLTGRSVREFQLGEQIGSGGFGVVYRAVQPSVNRDVAIKIILPRYANHPTFIRRFEAEAHLIARIEHPHIVPLYDYWREPNAAYLIMRYVRGDNLETMLTKGPLTLDQFRRITQQIGEALATAHFHGVVHRDIKPANVLLDDNKNAYLADFGIAKELARSKTSGLTEDGALIGSPAYISPEQIQDEPVGPYSDIYCFGLLMYEMLTGIRAFNGPTPGAYLNQHLNEPPPSLVGKIDEHDHALDMLVQRAAAKRPQDRFQHMEELLHAFHLVWREPASNLPVDDLLKTEMILSPEEIQGFDNPYLGLRPFSEGDAQNFFGRDALIQDMLAMLSDESDLERFVAVVGPSGSGKSSAVKAGLLPKLRRGALPGSGRWYIVDLTPGSHPLEEIEIALLRVAVNPPDSLLPQLKESSRGLLRAVRRILPADPKAELLLVIDQFEEVFTLVEDEAVRAHLLESLVIAVLDPRSRLRVVITMRADFVDRPLQYVDFGELVQKRLALVLPLTPDELTQAITGPLENLGMSMTPELLATITQEVGDQPGMLPLLQYALTELFEQREAAVLSLEDYAKTGGVTGSLARRADDLYESLDAAGKDAARQLFLRLVTLGEGVEDTRRRVPLGELESLTSIVKGKETSFLAILVADLFGEYRLLTFDHDPVTRERTVEVAHEALLREWPRLRTWMRESREDVRQQRELAAAAALWERNERDESYLLVGSRLTSYEAWAESTSVAVTILERDLLKTSIETRDALFIVEEARRQRELETAQRLAKEQSQRAADQGRAAQRFRYLTFGLAGMLILAVVAGWLARVRGQAAERNLIESERSRLALVALNAFNRGAGGDVAALLAIRSLKLGYSEDADRALQSALLQGISQKEYIGHTDDIQMVRFAPDGQKFISVASDSTVRLWDVQSGDVIKEFVGHEGPVYIVNFSADGRYLASSGADETVRVWDIELGAEIDRFEGGSTGSGVAFSPDGSRLVVSRPTKLDIHSIPDGASLLSLDTYSGTIGFNADFSPDGRYIAIAPTLGPSHIRDSQTGEILTELAGHSGWVSAIEFSPDSRFIFTTGQDGTARIWDVSTGNEVRRFVGHSDAIFNGEFSPDGNRVVTGSYDRTARVWDIVSGREIKRFVGHTDFVNVAFSPDGNRILTASGDEIIKLWDLQVEAEPKVIADFSLDHLQDQSAISISSDGTLVLVGRVTGRTDLVETDTGQIIHEFMMVNSQVQTVSISPDKLSSAIGTNAGLIWGVDNVSGLVNWELDQGRSQIIQLVFSNDNDYLIAATAEGIGLLIDTRSGEVIKEFQTPNRSINSIAMSSDSEWIATAGEDGIGYIWEVSTGEVILELSGHSSEVYSIVFSETNDQIATGGEDNSIILWDSNTGNEIQRFLGHTGSIRRLAFSPDNQYLISGSDDQTARLWELESGLEVHQYWGHLSPLFHVGFSKDGKSVFTADSESAFEWLVTLEELIDLACTRLSRDLSETERDFYGIADIEPTCVRSAILADSIEPTWTPISTPLAPIAGPDLVTELEFIPMEVANVVQMSMPV
ncbi:MAG: protein kinase, partial [Chloroflexota bacterium]